MKKLVRGLALSVILAVLFTFSSVSFINADANNADHWNEDWLHVEGNKIYDMHGNEVWLTGANWFGFNCSENVFHGAWYDVYDILSDIADRGINFLRIPVSTELLYSWMIGEPNPVSSVTASNNPPYHVCNPDFYCPETDDVKNSMEIFDIIMGYCKELGIKVMPAVHSPHADNSGHVYNLWYGTETDTAGMITTEMWIDTLVWLAEKYKNDDTMLALDIQNEPHGKRGYDDPIPDDMAIWDDSTLENNWKHAAELCSKAILDVNPNILVMIAGIEQYPKTELGYTFEDPDVFGATGDDSPYHPAWWGGNLRGVRDYPIDLGDLNSQMVYTPHEYGPSVWDQPWFYEGFTMETIKEDYMYDTWAFVYREGIAPVLIGEWGGHMDGGDNERWMTMFADYIKEHRLHHTFWCINPNSGDTGGLLMNDWSTWEEDKYEVLKDVLWQDDQGRFVGLDQRVPLGSNGVSRGEHFGLDSDPIPSDPDPDPTPEPDPDSTPEPDPDPTPEPEILYGDINGDGIVDSTDYILLSRIILEVPVDNVDYEAADVNRDGVVDTTDAIILGRYLLEMIDSLP
ncbi:cellulase family glycosylhydrolase [Herbivorax sp. ANBcel31]|uniref:cellulase family glycosylhydrolase n=1 Tax=Herbivorax sp. ANBcel31 TaxID=3069754 RepID=UPI0027B51E25|nr:cellulase family glycosylhydrolase [Herbivorax sp. ANBcel31]MDQ2086966.1 cellulase family glycosylhydrolase [Herbivorax sp. ANBcel31]